MCGCSDGPLDEVAGSDGLLDEVTTLLFVFMIMLVFVLSFDPNTVFLASLVFVFLFLFLN